MSQMYIPSLGITSHFFALMHNCVQLALEGFDPTGLLIFQAQKEFSTLPNLCSLQVTLAGLSSKRDGKCAALRWQGPGLEPCQPQRIFSESETPSPSPSQLRTVPTSRKPDSSPRT